jgi:pilus assembly protein CpaF
MIDARAYQEALLSLFSPVRPMLEDSSVSEIMINGPERIFIERRGRITLTEARFPNVEALWAAVRSLSQFIGKVIDNDHPILEGRLPDGSRVEAVMPPASPDGPMVSIRRFARCTLTLARLTELSALSKAAADALARLVVGKVNILIAGGTGTGKTSLLNALTGPVPDGERIVIIEDSREIQPQGQHVVQLESRPPDAKGRGEVTIRDLFRATLRMRPDRVIVGEVRGGEALDIVQAMLSGHGGCMGTLHATYPRDALVRLETMAMMGDLGLPLAAIRSQIGAAVQVIVQLARMRDGSRKITHITEVGGYDIERQQYRLQDLFRRQVGRGSSAASGLETKADGLPRDGLPEGELLPCRVEPGFLSQLEEHGVTWPYGGPKTPQDIRGESL